MYVFRLRKSGTSSIFWNTIIMKQIAYIFAFIIFVEIILLSLGYSVYSARMTIESSQNNIIFNLILCILFLIIGYFSPSYSSNRYTICPKCKESYNYSELKDGNCPKCDIKTVDIEEYYKKKKEEKQND